MRFKIVTNAFNGEKYIEKCLKSIQEQTLDFDCVFVDDASTDETFEIASDVVGEDKRFKIIKRSKNQGKMLSFLQGMSELSSSDDDIVVEVDGDDYLIHNKVLERVKQEYDNGALATYGQFRTRTWNSGICANYSDSIIGNRDFRHTAWIASHLKTYKYFLFKKIRKEDFMDNEGKPLDMVPDMVVMFSILEMVGNSVHFIPDVLYFYRTDNPMCAHNLNVEEQRRQEQVVRAREKYSILDVNAYEV